MDWTPPAVAPRAGFFSHHRQGARPPMISTPPSGVVNHGVSPLISVRTIPTMLSVWSLIEHRWTNTPRLARPSIRTSTSLLTA